MLKRIQLHKYQETAIDFIVTHREAALFLQMGLGKSVITLTAIQDLIDNIEVSSVLVVAPKKVAESTWVQEASIWEHLSGLRVVRVMGTQRQRAKALSEKADVYVTSRDLVQSVLDHCVKTNIIFDMLVIDELTSFKNNTAKRYKALRSRRAMFNRVVGLTGTPTPNGLKDLWAQMYLVDTGRSLGRSKTKYIDTFFNVVKHNNIIIKCVPKYGATEEIARLILPHTLTMKTADYLDMPDIIYNDILVCLPEDIAKKYRELERDGILRLKEALTFEDDSVVAANAAALSNKLCQFANGAVYNEDHLAVEFHDEKLDMLEELLEQANESGEHVLVFYQYKHDVDRILRRNEKMGLRMRVYNDEKDLTLWNNGNLDVLLTHPASTAYGLNLQRGGRVIIWFGTGWNAEYYEQGNARLHRQGQKSSVVVYNLAVKGTIDETALKAIKGKISSQNAMIEELKRIAKNYGIL
ncbi:MAG: SNF2-related protein [Muribaculaceae bacterium]